MNRYSFLKTISFESLASIPILLILLTQSSLALSFLGCKSTTQSTPVPWPIQGIKTVAIIGETSSDLTDFRPMLETAVGRVMNENNIMVFERSRIDKIIDELKFQSSDIVDAAQQAASLGKLKGVQALLLVRACNFTVGLSEITLTVTFRLIEVETGLTLAQHIENSRKGWNFISVPKSNIPSLIEQAVEDFARKRLSPPSSSETSMHITKRE